MPLGSSATAEEKATYLMADARAGSPPQASNKAPYRKARSSCEAQPGIHYSMLNGLAG